MNDTFNPGWQLNVITFLFCELFVAIALQRPLWHQSRLVTEKKIQLNANAAKPKHYGVEI